MNTLPLSQLRGVAGWIAVFLAAAMLPALLPNPYFLHTATLALIYVSLATAFDLVVGRVGALSLAQPLFYAVGAYVGALISIHLGSNLWLEGATALVAGATLSAVVGIPSFRLSLHTFAIGTVGFLLIGQLVLSNWVDVTGGTLCLTAISPLAVPMPYGTILVSTGTSLYYVVLLIAAVSILTVGGLSSTRVGISFFAVRDDPALASARGLWPTRVRLTAFAIASSLSALVGVFAAHFQQVVCPDQGDMSVLILLLTMVFVGGLGSLRGVVLAAVAFTVLPEVFRLADQWRLVVLGCLMLITVTQWPGGLEEVMRRVGNLSHVARSRG
jgi:branched-chain amino acid transport system permease protein